MNLIQCYQTQSSWYKNAPRGAKPVGILWHDTAAGNPNLKRYVQPSDDAPNRDEMLQIIGKNVYHNDWNHIDVQKGVNAWIGKLADGSVATIQAGEWDIHAWGCGNGSKGSCNGYILKNGSRTWTEQTWIQFEICDDGYKDRDYFLECYKEACEFTAYICELYGIDPQGTIEYAGESVPTILCHADSHEYDLGSDHGDVYLWFNKFGKTMEDVRDDVAKLMKKDDGDDSNDDGDHGDDDEIVVDYLHTPEEAQAFLNDLISHINNYFKK